MRFMNVWDIERALSRYDRFHTPNRLKGALTIERLADWANHNSDGWHSWPKPCRAAAGLIELLEGDGTWDDRQRLIEEDATAAELSKALRPIKAFLTRQGVDHSEVLV